METTEKWRLNGWQAALGLGMMAVGMWFAVRLGGEAAQSALDKSDKIELAAARDQDAKVEHLKDQQREDILSFGISEIIGGVLIFPGLKKFGYSVQNKDAGSTRTPQ